MEPDSFKHLPISDGFLQKWQEMANLIASLINVPATLIMKTENNMMEVFISSQSESNPYRRGEKEHWHGLYCETVIKTQNKLHIPNALKEKTWDKNPDIKLGMIAYLGYPINFPNQKPFGTLCVLDTKERTFTADNERLLLQFKNVIELDLALIMSLDLKGSFSHNEIIEKLIQDNTEYQETNEELQRTEERLRKSEEQFRTIFEIASLGIAQVDAGNGKIILVNKHYETITGYTVSELLNMTFLELTHPDDSEKDWEVFSRAARGEIDYRNEKRYIRKDGSIVWVRIHIAFIRDNDGNPIKTVAICEDTTIRKQTEDALRESEERFRALHNASFGGIAIHDKGLILDCNQGLSKISGYSLDELIGMNGLKLIAPGSRDLVMGNILSGYEKPYEAMGLRKNGESYPIRLEARNVPYKGKTVRSVEFRDITESKNIENEILKLNAELEQRVAERTAQLEDSNKELEAFSYSVSHDLRAPLRHINGYVNLLNEKFHADLPEKAQYYLATITDAARQMGTLIDDLLLFSRTRRQELNKTSIEMNAMVKEVIDGAMQSYDKREVLWKAHELPTVSGDHALIKQVMYNLIDNALKYTKHSNPSKICIECKEDQLNFVCVITGLVLT